MEFYSFNFLYRHNCHVLKAYIFHYFCLSSLCSHHLFNMLDTVVCKRTEVCPGTYNFSFVGFLLGLHWTSFNQWLL